MLTCKSPRKVLRVAHAAAARCLRTYSLKFSRHDFTPLQQLASLAVKEQIGTYRGPGYYWRTPTTGAT